MDGCLSHVQITLCATIFHWDERDFYQHFAKLIQPYNSTYETMHWWTKHMRTGQMENGKKHVAGKRKVLALAYMTSRRALLESLPARESTSQM